MSGVRAEVAVEGPSNCPVADVAAAAGAEARAVTRASPTGSDAPLAEEFTSDADLPESGRLEHVFDRGDRGVYRLTRDIDRRCICDFVEDAGAPVVDAHAIDGTLYVTFHAADGEQLREVVDRIDEAGESVSLRRITGTGEDADPVLVDRAELTDRQREILETAHEMGYFAYGEGANAETVAAELGIARSTFREILAAAQEKLLAAILAA